MLQQICRTCLATHGELVPIFTNNYYVHNLPDKLKHTLRIEVSEDDDLPQMMCKKCVFLVDSLYCFKDQCEMAEVKLKKTLLKGQLNNTRKSARVRDLSLTEFDCSRDEDYSDVLSSEDEYHIEYVSEEARLAVEGAKRLRRNAKRGRSSYTGVKVKSVEILPVERKNNNFKKSSNYKYGLTEANEETNATDSDMSSFNSISEDSKTFPKKNDMDEKSLKIPEKLLKPGFKRKLDLNNSYSQLTKVPKKVIFKSSEYDDENTQYIEVAENPKAKIEVKSTERTLPSTKIDSNMFQKRIHSFSLTSPKKSSNSLARTETSKSMTDSDNKKVSELCIQSLIKHVVLNNPRSCNICSDSFDTYMNMLKHKIQMHLNPEEKCFFCPICQEKFFSHKSLIKHLDTHKDIYSFMCVLCSENFYTEEMMRLHLASHVDLNELTCLTCTLKFDRLTNLLSHVDGHINKQLVCTFCIDSFDSKDSLQTHINEEHEISLENEKPENKKSAPKPIEKKKTARFTCPNCERNFASQSALRDHTLKKHPEFSCLVCDKKFPSQDERNEHTKQCHMKPVEQTVQTPTVDRKKFLCRVCHEILISRAAYTQHLKEKHCSPNQANETLNKTLETSQNEQLSHGGSNPPASEMT